MVIICFNTNAQWVKSGQTVAVSLTNGQDIDTNGDVYSTGILTCNTIFESDTLKNNTCGENDTIPITDTQVDAFLVKHDVDGNLVWQKQFSGVFGNELSANAVTVEPSGASYVAGHFNDTLIVDVGDTLFNNDTTHAFLVKVLPDGTSDWFRQTGSGDTATVFYNDLDYSMNEVVATGKFVGGLNFNTDTDSLDYESFFICSFDINGNELWMRNLRPVDPNSTSVGKAITIIGDTVLAVAQFTGRVRLVNDTLSVPGGGTEGSILMRYDLAGNLIWYKLLNTGEVEDVALTHTDSSIYLTGASTGITVIDDDTLFFDGGSKAFLSSQNLDGDLKWALPITSGGTRIPTGNSLSVNPQDNVFVGGAYFGATINVGGETALGNSDLNGFALKADSAGVVTWVQNLGGQGTESATSIAAFNEDIIYVGGFFSKFIRVGGEEVLKGSNGNNAYVARLDICPEVEVEMITADEVQVCDGETTTFQVTNNATYTYTWFKDGNPIVAPDAPNYTTGDEGEYYAFIDNGSGCAKRTPSSVLVVNPLPPNDVEPSGLVQLCAGDSITLLSPKGNYQWQWITFGTDILNDTLSESTIRTPGDYQVRVTNEFNCSSSSAVIQVQFLDFPGNTLNPTGRFVICDGDIVPISAEAGPGFTYEWYRDEVLIPGENAQTYNATTTGEYQAIVRNAIGCATETVVDTVVVQTAPIIDLNDEVISPILCNGDSVKIVTPRVLGQTYQWRRNNVDIIGETSNDITVKQGGDYTVYVQNATCDDESDVVSITISDPPPAMINSGDVIVCEGDLLTLEANDGPGFSYQWSRNGDNISGAQNRTYDVLVSGVYTVMVFNSDGCNTLSDDVQVTVNIAPAALVTPQSNNTFCQGDQLTLTANLGTALTYRWFRNDVLINGANDFELVVSTTGQYTVEVTNINLCSRLSDAQEVNVIDIPQASIVKIGQDNICVGDSLQLQSTINPIYEYQWLRFGVPLSDEFGSNVFIKEAGQYQSVVSIGACRDTSEVLEVAFVPNPKPDIVRNVDFLSTSLFGDIMWFKDGELIVGASSQNIQVQEDGVYKVSVINANGCVATSDSISVCVPIAELNRFEDEITVTPEYDQYEWYFGDNLIKGAERQTLVAQQSGIYSAIVTNETGCRMRTDEIEVCVPFPFITQDEDTGILFANPDVANAYQWYYDSIPLVGEDLNVLIPDSAGLYRVEVLDFDNCLSLSEVFEISVITGISSIESTTCDIFPNPFDNQLFITFNNNESLNVKIYNTKGIKVLEQSYKEGDELNTSHLPSGSYILLLAMNEQVYFQKLIKR